MELVEELKIQNASGRVLTLQHVKKGLTFLDQGTTHLPRDFEGYSVKFTDQIAQPRADGSFQVGGEVFRPVGAALHPSGEHEAHDA